MLSIVPVAPAAKADLLARMSGADRHYHTAHHLALLWQRHRRFSAAMPALHTAETDHLIACAITFHDAIYEPRQGGNEAASAALWRQVATHAARPADEIDWVSATIEATANHLGTIINPRCARDHARLWVLDLDLTPIGETPEQFGRNTALLRAEFAHLDDAAWDRSRLAFLGSLAAYPKLYRCAPITDAFEAQARENIARELAAVSRS